MAWFLGGLGALIAFVFAANAFSKANPRKLAIVLRNLGGIAALLLAALLALRGLVVLAIPLGLFGAALLGLKLPFGLGGAFGDARHTPGRQSEVKTSFIAMTLDHDSGRMDGTVRAGRFQGRTLESLSMDEILTLGNDLSTDDPQGLRLLEAWLDRRDPEWRDKAKARGRQPAASGAMSRAEALEILGLTEGATEDQIRHAHRTLMKKMHPDQGGSNWFASRLNEAKDVLLG